MIRSGWHPEIGVGGLTMHAFGAVVGDFMRAVSERMPTLDWAGNRWVDFDDEVGRWADDGGNQP